MVEHLDRQLPTIELLLGKLDLAPHENEKILQKFKDKVRFVQRQACSLYPKKSCEKMNVELIARWSIRSIEEIAVPYSIRERAAIAKRCRLGTMDRLAEYGSSLLSGAGTFVALSTAIAGTALAINTYQNGWDNTILKAKNLFTTQSGKWL